MFLTDLCLHLNELNAKLQYVNKTIVIMFDLIKAFEAKLDLFNRDVMSNIYKYFSYTKKFFADLEFHEKPNKVKLTKDFSEVIQSIINEFAFRFKQFKQFAETSKFLLYPDKTSADRLNLEIFEWLNLEDIEIQLIDFQSSSLWKQKFIDLRNDF